LEQPEHKHGAHCESEKLKKELKYKWDKHTNTIVIDDRVSSLNYIKEFFFYLFDGQGFFGFEEKKIMRING
jgi:hypothetical protein